MARMSRKGDSQSVSSMRLTNTVSEAIAEIRRARIECRAIGLVPTMGALHDGHMALVDRARRECDYVAVSIFVNPTQFSPSEDLDRYPRTLESDIEKCEAAGVDLIFAPFATEMYPTGFDTWIEVKGLTDVLEGASRPNHFRGVTTVCLKLFNIIAPDRAYFGMKDYQQFKVVQKMALDLNMPPEIIPVETVREPDGLAMSSRNRYLSNAERSTALVLSRSLKEAKTAHKNGERSASAVQVLVENLIKTEPLAHIDYVAVVDAETLQPIDTITRPAVVLLAVRIGSTRLIDSAMLM